MSIYQQQDLNKFLQACKDTEPEPIYLIHGDRFLCQRLTDQLLPALLPAIANPFRHIKKIDGEQENPQETITSLKTWPLFAKRQIFMVSDSRLFSEGNDKNDPAIFLAALNEGLPPGNILILINVKNYTMRTINTAPSLISVLPAAAVRPPASNRTGLSAALSIIL